MDLKKCCCATRARETWLAKWCDATSSYGTGVRFSSVGAGFPCSSAFDREEGEAGTVPRHRIDHWWQPHWLFCGCPLFLAGVYFSRRFFPLYSFSFRAWNRQTQRAFSPVDLHGSSSGCDFCGFVLRKPLRRASPELDVGFLFALSAINDLGCNRIHWFCVSRRLGADDAHLCGANPDGRGLGRAPS